MNKIIIWLFRKFVLVALFLAGIVVFGNHPWVGKLRYKIRVTFNINPPVDDWQQGLNLKKQKKYLANLKEKFSKKVPTPEMIKLEKGELALICSQIECPDSFAPLEYKTVEIGSFEIAATETSIEQWDVCVAMGGCEHMPYNYNWGRGDLPVLNVSYYDAIQYIDWLNSVTDGGYRLPTEHEWEYAARAGTNTRYQNGNQPPTCEQFRLGSPAWKKQKDHECKIRGTRSVVSGEPNNWGLYNVLGNAAEWTVTCKSIYRQRVDLRNEQDLSLEKKCKRSRVNRGGNLMTNRKITGFFHAREYSPEHRYNRVGFRLARSVKK